MEVDTENELFCKPDLIFLDKVNKTYVSLYQSETMCDVVLIAGLNQQR